MRRALPCLALLAALAGLAGSPAALAADEVYTWTDADGVTHYGDAPPPSGLYEKRTVRSGAPRAQDADDKAVADKAEDPVCAEARTNLDLLRGDRPLQQDTDGDGKPDKTLSQADREAQLALAEAMLKVNCAAPE